MSHPLTGWTISEHALERIRAMDVPPAHVADAIIHPALAYPGAAHHPPGRRVHVAHGIAVVVDPIGRRVITILGHRAEGRDADGRPIYT